ncbi:MAG: hypothetical protein IKW74_00325, partial [Thermoguttaceae bacterium]|nr:hypothetical protein [Thermoguttaceae bacterium]
MLPIKPIEQIIIALEMNAGHNTIMYFKNTPGVQKADVEELSEWVKTIQIKSIVPLNLFFIPFSSGRYAIGRVTPNCNENPETLPERYNIFVQVMVVTPGTLLAYGNNPILVYQAALHSGTLHQILPHDNKISTIHLGNSPKWIDKSILLGLSVNPGIRAITFLMETILTHPQTLFIGDTQPFFVILALFNLLPIHSRVKLTFANSIFP